MKRIVAPGPIEAIGLAPADFAEKAQRAIDALPDRFDQAAVVPLYEYGEDGWPVAYAGAGWWFVRGRQYAAFATPSPAALLDDGARDDYLRKVDFAFEKRAQGEAMTAAVDEITTKPGGEMLTADDYLRVRAMFRDMMDPA